MRNVAIRLIAPVAISVVLALGSSLVAGASVTTTTSPAPAHSALHQYQVAKRHYFEELKVINYTFVAAIKTAKSNYALALATAKNSTERISARASFKLAIAEATVARANALVALGKLPAKPRGVHPT